MPPVMVDPDKVREFVDFRSFYDWLQRHHRSGDEVWIKLHKRGSGLASITAKEAIDAALCWGWIDGIRKGLDERSFLQRYTPRRAKSIWSQVNVDNVARLEEAGLMTEHGRAQVLAAQADGRWQRAYGAGATLETPPALLEAIAADPAALATYAKLNAQNRYALAFRLHNLKTEIGRQKRIRSFVEMLARGEAPYPQSGLP